MKKHVFITGAESAACSSLLREALGPALAVAGGYVKTVSTESEDSRVLSLSPAASAAGVAGYESYPFLFISGHDARKDNEVFRTHGVRLLQEAVYYPFAVLDDIGGFELVIPQYRQALAELLSDELPIIGVLKGHEEAIAQAQNLGLSERFAMLCARLHEALREDSDTLVLELKRSDDEAARRVLQQWSREYVF